MRLGRCHAGTAGCARRRSPNRRRAARGLPRQAGQPLDLSGPEAAEGRRLGRLGQDHAVSITKENERLHTTSNALQAGIVVELVLDDGLLLEEAFVGTGRLHGKTVGIQERLGVIADHRDEERRVRMRCFSCFTTPP